MTEQERIKMLQNQERARQGRKFLPSEGPQPGSVLSGRRGVAEGVPLTELTPDQRKAVDYTPFTPGVPRLPRTGMNAWDQRVNDGAGGYVPRAPSEHALASGQGLGVKGMAAAFGIDPTAYEPDSAQLAADLAAVRQRHDRLTKDGKYTVEEIPGGGSRYKPGAPMIAQQESRKRTDALRTLATRFKKEIRADNNNDGVPDFTSADLEAAYDDPANAGKSHNERMRFVNDNVVNQFRTDRAMNTQDAIETRAKQDNMASRLGTSRAAVTFHDDLANAKTPEDRIRVLLSYHAMHPQLGLGNMAAYTQRGEDEARSMEAMGRNQQAQLAAQNPMARTQQDLAAMNSLPPGAARMEARKTLVKNGFPGGAAPPEAINDAIVTGEVDTVRGLTNKPDMTEDDHHHIREWTNAFLAKNKLTVGKAGYTKWAKMIGVTPWSPQASRLWRIATGQDIEETNNPLVPDDWFYGMPFMNDPRQKPDAGA